uniref:Uncharacterized protein n=1 Tax=Moniliophthora roreri TaxID=221103 RepID=A0A0W0FJ82_MONRR
MQRKILLAAYFAHLVDKQETELGPRFSTGAQQPQKSDSSFADSYEIQLSKTKWFASVIALFAIQGVVASPVEKRASVNDVANITSLSMPSSKLVSTLRSLGLEAPRSLKLALVLSMSSIFRNLKISKFLADAGDAIGIQASSQVWVDHVDLSSNKTTTTVCLISPMVALVLLFPAASSTTTTRHLSLATGGRASAPVFLPSASTLIDPSSMLGHGHINNNFFDSNKSDGIK